MSGTSNEPKYFDNLYLKGHDQLLKGKIVLQNFSNLS